jgi:hypothetical protein
MAPSAALGAVCIFPSVPCRSLPLFFAKQSHLILCLRERWAYNYDDVLATVDIRPPSSVPGIDENDPKVFEVTDVARGEGRFARGGDTGDLDVADLDRLAD